MPITIKSSGAMVGDIKPWPSNTLPADGCWLECAGQVISRTGYPVLFGVIGTTFGAGDGSTTFGLPDLRGRAIFGKDNMNGGAANRLTSGGSGVNGSTLGAVGGGESVTLTTAQMPAHGHSGFFYDGGIYAAAFVNQSATSSGAAGSTQSTGGGGAHVNIPPALVCNLIIKVI